MKKLKLTDYGTVVLGDNEVKIDTFLKLLKSCEGYFDVSNSYWSELQDFKFDKDSSSFKIETSCHNDTKKYRLDISDMQKELLDLGKPSPELLKLIAFAEECQYKKRQEQISDKFYETGKLPTDPEELVIYNDLLHQKLNETKADIVKNGVITSIVPTFFGASFLFLSSYLSKKTGTDPGFVRNCLLSALSTLIPLGGFAFVEQNPFPIGKINADLEKMEILRKKIKILEASEEKQNALKMNNDLSIEGFENKEIKSVKERSNTFLDELEVVKSKIAMLPEVEREPYIRELVGIVERYRNQVFAILDNDGKKVLLGCADNLWSLNSTMLPILFELGGAVDKRLSTLRESQELKDALNELESSVATFSDENGYTDGWTDGYTDELNGSGQAYASHGM